MPSDHEVDATYGQLTDEKIKRRQSQIGLWRRGQIPHNYEVTWDGTRHFAYGAGDNNPLWCERDYGEATRWGGLIAPPNFMWTVGENDAPALTQEQRAIAKGDPLAGLGSYQAVMEYEWWRPLHVGDRVRTRAAYVGVVPKQSEFGGRSVHETSAFLYRNQSDELTSIRRGTWIRAERKAKAERSFELTDKYDEQELARIDAAYETESRRGAEVRYWEDVQIGDELDPQVKGPLRITDLIVWHIGWGMQLTPPGAFRLSYEIRKKVPGLFTPNEFNVPDTVQRLHWDTEWANQLGLPRTYDYGALRETWLTFALTDWMGDDGWLWKLSCEHRRFNFQGDTTWIRGKVISKEQNEGRNEVHLEVWCENQFGTVTSPGTAVVLLPTRSGAVVLPSPPVEDFDEMFQLEIARYSEPV
jgi:acyl dehydratase